MVGIRRLTILIFLIIPSIEIFSLDPPPVEVDTLKDSIMGNIARPCDVVTHFGDDYIYEELDVYGMVPNAYETDKMLVFDYDGLKFMFFRSEKYEKLFLYYWEISDNEYILDQALSIGLKHDDFKIKYGSSHNHRGPIESYSFRDGDLYLKFSDNILVKIYWRPSD